MRLVIIEEHGGTHPQRGERGLHHATLRAGMCQGDAIAEVDVGASGGDRFQHGVDVAARDRSVVHKGCADEFDRASPPRQVLGELYSSGGEVFGEHVVVLLSVRVARGAQIEGDLAGVRRVTRSAEGDWDIAFVGHSRVDGEQAQPWLHFEIECDLRARLFDADDQIVAHEEDAVACFEEIEEEASARSAVITSGYRS